MNSEPQTNSKPAQKANQEILLKTLALAGIGLMGIGAIGYFNMEWFSGFMSMTEEDTTFVATLLLFVGATDILLAGIVLPRFIFKNEKSDTL